MSRVVVIGGGVVGVACALELAQRGASVTLLERDEMGHGCSFGNAGWLTPSLALPLPTPGMLKKASAWLLDPSSPFYIKPRLDPSLIPWLVRFVAATRRDRFERGAAALVELCRWSVDAWEDLSRRTDTPFGFRRDGILSVHESAESFAAGRGLAELVSGFGVPFETWTAEQVLAREPALHGSLVGGLFFPRDAFCEPYPAVVSLAGEARNAGVRIVENAEVIGVERADGRVCAVTTPDERFEAGEFVVAVGVWSRSLGRRFGLRLPVLGGRGYSFVVPPLDPHPSRALYLADRKIAVNPHADSLRVSGTLELVGEDLSINARRVEAIVRGAGGLLDLPESVGEVEPWSGLRPCTPDGMPLIGRARGHDNLWLATGHQMTGLKTAPGTGRLLAELMTGAAPTFDPEPFRADRY